MNLLKSKLTIITALAVLVMVLSGTAQFNLKDNKMCYVACYAHLDTQWGWDMGRTIKDWIPNTFRDNFSHFSRFDKYIFSFEGAYRYYLMKQYYPSDYSKLKNYVQQGKWAPTGCFVDGCDVNIPSPESLIRHILYGNAYFEEEFDKTSIDILLPDCFDFPYSLPTIATHCGIYGFSTQKFHLWGGWRETPFPIGLWEGVDGSQIIACLKPGSYGDQALSIREDDGNWLKNNSKNNGSPGV